MRYCPKRTLTTTSDNITFLVSLIIKKSYQREKKSRRMLSRCCKTKTYFVLLLQVNLPERHTLYFRTFDKLPCCCYYYKTKRQKKCVSIYREKEKIVLNWTLLSSSSTKRNLFCVSYLGTYKKKLLKIETTSKLRILRWI